MIVPYAAKSPLNAICPYTFAPSNRVLRRLVQVAKGFAILKHAKIANALKNSKGKMQGGCYIFNPYTILKWGWMTSIQSLPLILHSKTFHVWQMGRK